MEYSHNFGSNFPASLIPAGTKKDIDDTVKDLITEYYSCLDAGELDKAQALYGRNKDILEDYAINMAYINRLEEEIYNTGLNVLQRSTCIISTEEPIEQPYSGCWYQDY